MPMSSLPAGMENMSRIPYALPALRDGARMFNVEAVDLMVHDGLVGAFLRLSHGGDG